MKICLTASLVNNKYHVFGAIAPVVGTVCAIIADVFRYQYKMKGNLTSYVIAALLLCFAVSSCVDEEYTTSRSDVLSFANDTVRMDTVFCNIPSSTKSFWVFNKSKKSIRVSSVRLNRGNQSGFRVNVDGIYLGQETGFQTSEVEIMGGDSIRVYVELTAPANDLNAPKKIEDDLSFTLESGVTQKVNLNAFAWKALILNNVSINADTTWSGKVPIVVYGALKVDSLATLTISSGTTVYFRDDAKLDVYGRLLCKGEPGKEVVLRGYRLDNMFDYLPYDRVSGQWGGVRFRESSYGNELHYTDLHSAYTGIEVDSCDTETPTLTMNMSTVHNCQGYGVVANCSRMEFNNCQFTNTLKDCFHIEGGDVSLNNCTLAQFYPYDSNRGAALFFSADKGDLTFLCRNTLVTGYADDVVNGLLPGKERKFDVGFEDCILRTPQVTVDKTEEDVDTVRFSNVMFESCEDTVTTGKKHFKTIDTDKLIYNFQLDSISPAVDRGNPLTAEPIDRLGLRRDEKPDIGAFERTN